LIEEISRAAECGWAVEISSVAGGSGNAGEGALINLIEEGTLVHKDGMVTIHGHEELLDMRGKADGLLQEHLHIAEAFISRLTSGRGILLAGISGSLSYETADRGSDIDILIVTRRGRLWISILRALLIARMMRSRRSDCPTICLSYCTDDAYFMQEVREHRSRLFASDFLHLKVIYGQDYYRNALQAGEWMASVYPLLYTGRRGDARIPAQERRGVSVAEQIINNLLFILLGSYLKSLSIYRSWKFRKRKLFLSEFKAVLGTDRCIYESNKWRFLENNSANMRHLKPEIEDYQSD